MRAISYKIEVCHGDPREIPEIYVPGLSLYLNEHTSFLDSDNRKIHGSEQESVEIPDNLAQDLAASLKLKESCEQRLRAIIFGEENGERAPQRETER